jgi:hypothetical protein
VTHSNRLDVVSVAVAVLVATLTLQAQQQGAAAQEPKGPPMVSVAALQPLLPTLDGWTKAKSGGNRVVISDEAGYTFADGVFTKGNMNVRVTVADTAATQDCLLSLATMVTTLPEGYSDEVPPATVIKRLTVNGMPAAYRWDGEKREGEYTVVIGGRFVAKVEGTNLETVDALRAILDQIDMQKLGALKPGK